MLVDTIASTVKWKVDIFIHSSFYCHYTLTVHNTYIRICSLWIVAQYTNTIRGMLCGLSSVKCADICTICTLVIVIDIKFCQLIA